LALVLDVQQQSK
jgi:hypothetical protein